MLIKNSDQNTSSRNGRECDECQNQGLTTYAKGYAYVARGATGRWCEVIWICDACGELAEKRQGAEALDVTAARELIATHNGDWSDF